MENLKRLTRNAVMVMLAVLLSVSFTSCGDDDDDEGAGSNALVGTWKGSESESDNSDVTTMTFRADGTMEAHGYEINNPNDNWSFTGTYRLETHDNGVYLISIGGYFAGEEDEYYDDDIVFRPCYINGNTLDIFFDGNDYRLYRQ